MLLHIAGLALALAAPEQPATFTLWQLPEQSPTQMQSYVIRTVNGKLIVIDGGNAADGPYLKGFLAALGNHVHQWFISHPHSDHVGAVNAILDNPGKLKIDTFLASLPELDWLEEQCNGEAAPDTRKFLDQAARHNIPIRDLALGETFSIDGIHVKILGIRNPEITGNCVNNSSMAWRMWDEKKSILFTGDLGAEASEKLLAGDYAEDLPSEYVQMSHHGQAGAVEAFYQKANPTYCLWPTPAWLWDNNNGGGKGSGPWQTLKVRAWMDKLDVKQHYITKDGLHRID